MSEEFCVPLKYKVPTISDLIADMMDKRSFFAKTVEHLARCLAAMKPTPWEKVHKMHKML